MLRCCQDAKRSCSYSFPPNIRTIFMFRSVSEMVFSPSRITSLNADSFLSTLLRWDLISKNSSGITTMHPIATIQSSSSKKANAVKICTVLARKLSTSPPRNTSQSLPTYRVMLYRKPCTLSRENSRIFMLSMCSYRSLRRRLLTWLVSVKESLVFPTSSSVTKNGIATIAST